MDKNVALTKLHDVLHELRADGFIVTGQLSICKPKTPGVLNMHIIPHWHGPAPWIEATTTRAGVVEETSKIVAVTVTPEPSPTSHGDVCTNCGGIRFIQTGTCKTCADCGTSHGGCG